MLHLHGSLARDSERAMPASGALWTTAAATVTTAKPLARRDAHGAKHFWPINARAPLKRRVWDR